VAPSPLLRAAALTLLWHLVLFAAAFGLPELGVPLPGHPGAAVVSLVAALVPVAVLVRGRGRAPWLRRVLPRRPWLLLPVVLVSAGYLAPGIEGSTSALASTAVAALAVALSEELLGRGVVQDALAPLGPRRQVLWVGLLFGLGHALSGAVFGRPLDDTVAQVVSTAAFGAGFAALRLHTGTIWPLVVLHAAYNWCQLVSPGAAPWPWQLAVAVGFAGGAWALTTPQALAGLPGRPAVRMDR
jgi:uncharacterized protein